MRPLSQLPPEHIRAVFTDLDDTVTDHGRISSGAYQALWDLKNRGLYVAVISGRPAGWADALMRLWPLDAMVFENGAGLLVRGKERTEVVNLAQGDRGAQRQRLESIFQGIRKQIPHAKLASDQPYRLFDYALDFTEDPPRLSAEELEWVLKELGRHPEITFKLSSIHVNFWYGKHTKVTACEYLLNQLRSQGIERGNVLYCGDSPNDEPLFEFFPNSVGVANVAPFLDRMKNHPTYVAGSPGGSGFQEIASHLLSL